MRQRPLLAALAVIALVIPILACGSSGPTCLGWVQDDQGVRRSPRTGTVEGREQAQRLGCNAYCIEADPEVQVRYQIWLDSPRGNPSLTKWDAMYDDPSLLAYVTGPCADRCLADVASGARPGGVDCE